MDEARDIVRYFVKEFEAFLIKKVADELSYEIGDTFIDFRAMPPDKQWMRIVGLLHDHGFMTVKIPRGDGDATKTEHR
jgi:hypothetical protein